MTNLERLTLRTNNLEFNALAAGSMNGDLVLLLHGFPEFADMWTPLLHRLSAAGYRAVAFDQRGYSPEARPAAVENYQLDLLLADLFGVADVLSAPRFHLIGHDWGGLLAWYACARYPDRIRTVSILATPHPDAFFWAIENDADQQRRSQYIKLIRAPLHAAEAVLKAGHFSPLRSAYQGKLTPAAIERNIERLSQPGALTAALNWYRALDWNASIGTVATPALYILGSEDPFLGHAAAEATASLVAGPYRFVMLEGRSHWLIEEAPDEVAGHILQHVRSLD